ncbi:MAG: exodeoxyribonuclease III [Patescibacteria group bacterium]
MKLISWNVNGIRAAVRGGFAGFLESEKPDILGLQEIKITHAAREKEKFDFKYYEEFWNPAERPGYSGTAILVHRDAIQHMSGGIINGIGVPEFDKEGRVQTAEFEKFYFVNIYFPNANHELSRLDYKLRFNEALLKYAKKLEKRKPVIMCGDFNVAHAEIDIKNAKANIGNAGFTYEERGWMDKFLKAGFVDTFRSLNKNKIQYSWWSYMFRARERNIGWRIDYFLVSKKITKNIKNAFILDQVKGSDHAPVGIILK